MTDILFYFLASMIILASVLVVTVKNILHAALSLIFALFVTAGLFILLRAEFIAAAQVLVYIGGVVIFIVFTIFLTSRLSDRFFVPRGFSKGLAALAGLGFISLGVKVLAVKSMGGGAGNVAQGKPIASMVDVGARLLDTSHQGFIVPFEIVSILLLAAIIGAITIAKKDKPSEKSDDDVNKGASNDA